VQGNVKDPKVEVVPSPVLNEAQAVVFGTMLGKSKDRQLIDALKPSTRDTKK
jgi:hypothetical protein